jgi:hypothetical protein
MPVSLDRLHERHPGLTPALGDTFAEAARVSLSRHHESPVFLEIRFHDAQERRGLLFDQPEERTKNAHANLTDATSWGAYGISLAVLDAVAGLVGSDWYVAPADAPDDDLEATLRLEVGGVGPGTVADVLRYLKSKVEQAGPGGGR